MRIPLTADWWQGPNQFSHTAQLNSISLMSFRWHSGSSRIWCHNFSPNPPHRTQTAATGSHRWCYKSLLCLPSLLIIPSVWNDLHSPLHMHKRCPSFTIYLQRHFLHEMSLPLLALYNLSPLPTTLPYGPRNVILYFVRLLSVCVFPPEILENRVYRWWMPVLQGLAHRMCSLPWDWMTVVSWTRGFYVLFLSLGKYYNCLLFSTLQSLNTHFFL